MKIIAVQSTKRPDNIDYLGDTLASLDKEGAGLADKRFVEFDGRPWKALPPSWESFSSSVNRGGRLTLWSLFRRAYAMGAERLVSFEDDVIGCKNAVRWALEVFIPPDLPFLSMLDIKQTAQWWQEKRLYRIRTIGTNYNNFSGCQALIFPRRTLELLSRISDQEVDAFAEPHVKNQQDTFLGIYLWMAGHKRYGAVTPSLFHHIGENSVAAPGSRTIEKRFAGPDFDAMSLGKKLAEEYHP